MKHIDRYIDLAFCLVFLPLMIYAFPVERWWATRPWLFVAFILWLYAAYFLYKYCCVPMLFGHSRRRLWAVGLIVLSLGVTFLFTTFDITSPFYHLRQSGLVDLPVPVWGVRPNRQAVWLYFIIVVFFSFAVQCTGMAYRARLAREEAEYERGRAELERYKAQINPHFVFNTLNTIYGLLIARSDKTEAAMERFINLTKYLYRSARREWITLNEETDYISQYIDLQRLRLGANVEVSFTRRVSDASVLVPPLMLITFVENAFKHGISSDAPSFVHIALRQDKTSVTFEVENSWFDRPADSQSRTGLDNCCRRLDLLYPGRHRLDYGHSGPTYRVQLVLQTADKTTGVAAHADC